MNKAEIINALRGVIKALRDEPFHSTTTSWAIGVLEGLIAGMKS